MFKNMCRVVACASACVAILGFWSSASAAPVEYVKICSDYGAGFYYIPGTDTCLKLSGFVRPDERSNSNGDWGWNVQGLGYLGSVSTSSFGSNFDTNVIGGRAAAGIRLPGQFRLQGDLQGEGTGTYCPLCGERSYFAGGIHVDWNVISNVDIGLFGGFANINPTFSAPKSDYTFLGVEARYFTMNWMVGGQVGRLDVSNGPGTLTDAWFAEGRLRFSVGYMFNVPGLQNLGFGANLGYASGNLSGTAVSAETRHWGLSLGYRFRDTPLTGFVGYHGYTNSIGPLGTVWNEHIVKAGVKVDFGTPGSTVPIEPMAPLPTVLRTMMTF